MKRISLVLAVICLAACSRPVPTTDAGKTSVDNIAARVENLSPAQREGVLFRAIRDAGMSCQQITQQTAMPRDRGQSVWRAQCDDGRYYLVEVAKDGTATVINRP